MKMHPEVLPQLADKVKHLREVRDELEEKTEQANAELKRAEQDLVALMVDVGMKNFTKSGTQFSVVTKVRASAAGGRKDDLYAALKAKGYGDLVYETVNANSLSAFVKEQIESDGNDDDGHLPGWLNGLVNIYEQTKIQLRKSK